MASRQNSRHIKIQLLIQNKPGISFQEILEALKGIDYKVSNRTLERDMEHLRFSYGKKLNYNRKLGGYVIEDVDKHESQMLIRMQENLNETELIKLSQQKEFKEIIEFEKTLETPDPSYFRIIAEAIGKKKLIQIRYLRYGRTEAKTHIVQPRLLKEYQDRWYLVTTQANRTDPIVFSLDTNRMLEVNILTETFKPKEKLEVLKKRFEDVIGVSVYEEEPAGLVIIAIPSEQAGYIESQPWHHSQEFVKEENNERFYSFWLSWNIELEKRVLSFMPFIRIVEPPFLKAQILQILQTSIENNK